MGPGHSRVLFSEARFKSPMLPIFPDELLGETFLSLVPVLEEGMVGYEEGGGASAGALRVNMETGNPRWEPTTPSQGPSTGAWIILWWGAVLCASGC